MSATNYKKTESMFELLRILFKFGLDRPDGWYRRDVENSVKRINAALT
jgi:hypothetical protein